MDHLDFGEIMEQNECWFEDYDLTCPHCRGNPDVEVKTWALECGECGQHWKKECKEHDDDYDEEPELDCPDCGEYKNVECSIEKEETVYCEECTEGQFEVMWNTAFSVVVYGGEFDEKRKEAWDLGWCLIEHSDGHYLLAGSCGYDFSWKLAHARWKLQGWLDLEDINAFLHSGGHVFLNKAERAELLRYARQRLPTLQEYEQSYHRDLEKIDGLLFPEKEEEHAH